MRINNGIWPVMITPFHENAEIDYEGLEKLIEWYLSQGCDGLFAVCQSSEMFFLSLDERIKLAKAVVTKTAGRASVVASGHVSYSLKDQAKELSAIADTGIDGLVLVSNRFVSEKTGSDREFIDNMKQVLSLLPSDVPLGFYECPYPFKRLLTPDVLKFCRDSGRFCFIKDTSCDGDNIREKLEILKGSGVKLFNANTATLLESLRDGASGYSGVMANFHPVLYKWLYEHWKEQPEKAEEVQSLLSMCALIEMKKYPACVKRYLRLYEGLPVSDYIRKDNIQPVFCDADDHELIQLKKLSDLLVSSLC